jgi:hypothetical protein
MAFREIRASDPLGSIGVSREGKGYDAAQLRFVLED